MSKTKEYIDEMKEQGIDVTLNETVYTQYDAEYEQYLFEKKYRESLEEMTKTLSEKNESETNSKSE